MKKSSAPSTTAHSAITLLAFIVVSQLAGAIGSIFTFSAIPTWYATLAKSPLNPPGWVFGPVWTTLFLLMGIAAFLVWHVQDDRHHKRVALTWFSVQLGLNALWSILFFGAHSPAAALIEIMALWIAILITLVKFFKLSRVAGFLFLPYLAWVSFAIYLNGSVWWLN